MALLVYSNSHIILTLASNWPNLSVVFFPLKSELGPFSRSSWSSRDILLEDTFKNLQMLLEFLNMIFTLEAFVYKVLRNLWKRRWDREKATLVVVSFQVYGIFMFKIFVHDLQMTYFARNLWISQLSTWSKTKLGKCLEPKLELLPTPWITL